MAMTMQAIMKFCPQQRRKLSTEVKIVATKLRKKNGYPMFLAKTRSLTDAKGRPVPAGRANVYLTSVEIYEKRQVIVSCSCDDWTFFWEFACNKKGAARIEYSNGEPPKEKNVNLVPGCCKHLYKVGTYMIEKGMI